MAITSPYWPTGQCGTARIPLSKLSITRGTSPTGYRKYLPPSRPQNYFRRRAFLDGAIPCDDEPSQSRAPEMVETTFPRISGPGSLVSEKGEYRKPTFRAYKLSRILGE